MNKFFIALSFSVLTLQTTHSQTNFQADLDALYAILKKTPSYKDQIRGEKQKELEATYFSLRTDTIGIANAFDNFYKLARLIFPIRDNHLGFRQLPWAVPAKEQLTGDTAIRQYRESSFFKNYPRVELNYDSLQRELSEKPRDSVEGIYYYDDYLVIGLYRTEKQSELTGIVLNTSLPNWEKGQVAIRLFEYLPYYYRAIYGHPAYKNLMLYNNEKFRNHSLVNSYFYSSFSESFYKKTRDERDYINIPRSEPGFQFKNITEAIQYIRLGNFSARPQDMKISQAFYDKIKDSLTVPDLIVDLRDNTGGAYKVSKKFLQLLKRYTKKGNVYVLINNGTMSQGEKFTLQLKPNDRVHVYGQTTKGTIAYGSNTGKTEILPSGLYSLYITDMKDKGNYFPYESFGVEPERLLNNDEDWIKQLVAEIAQK